MDKLKKQEQINDLWEFLEENIAEPEKIDSTIYNNDYNFSFLKEIKSEISSTSSIDRADLAHQTSKQLERWAKEKPKRRKKPRKSRFEY